MCTLWHVTAYKPASESNVEIVKEFSGDAERSNWLFPNFLFAIVSAARMIPIIVFENPSAINFGPS